SICIRLIRRPVRSTLLPYTTLFRSLEKKKRVLRRPVRAGERKMHPERRELPQGPVHRPFVAQGPVQKRKMPVFPTEGEQFLEPRSEEHTSELQSRENLVCRLLLEKK